MAFLSITKAAQVAGVSRGTIYNKIEDGELSKGPSGIDTAELLRVFGTLRDTSDDDKSAKKTTASNDDNALTAVLARQNDEFTRQLTDQLEAAERDKQYLREMAEKREQVAIDLQNRLNDMVKSHDEERQTWASTISEFQKRLPAPEDLKPRKKLFGLF